MHAVAVNYPDLLRIANTYQVSVPLPFIPGSEFSGTVLEAAPDVAGLRPGDAVIGIAPTGVRRRGRHRGETTLPRDHREQMWRTTVTDISELPVTAAHRPDDGRRASVTA